MRKKRISPGKESSTISFQQKSKTPKSAKFPIKITQHQRDSLLHYAELKEAIKKRVESAEEGTQISLGGRLYGIRRDRATGDYTIDDGTRTYTTHRGTERLNGTPTFAGYSLENLVSIDGVTYDVTRIADSEKLLLEQLHAESALVQPYDMLKVDEKDYRDWAQQSNEELIPKPLSLYFHIPFCSSICFYCACNKVITNDKEKAEPYLQDLHREIEIQADLFDHDREVHQLFWERIMLHVDAEKASDEDLPFCTAEDRWEKPTQFAVMKNKNKRASKLCGSVEEAEQYITGLQDEKNTYNIVERPGESIRCESYCPVKEFCSQYKKMKEE